jgi:hypothetical protein
MPDEGFGVDLSNWEKLTPAQRSTLTRLFVRRAHAARNRNAGKVLLAALNGIGEWLRALVRQRPVLALRHAAGLPRPARRRKEF